MTLKEQVKVWPLDLFDQHRDCLRTRIKEIERLGGEFAGIKRHKFSLQKDFLKLNTDFIERESFPVGERAIVALNQLASDLNDINQYIPHGDILIRNAIWDGNYFILIDWEPLLEYGVAPKVLLRSTVPYISTFDLNSSKISSKTDKLAFFYFCRKVIHGWFPTDKKEVLAMEGKVISKNFLEIVSFSRELYFQ